MTVENLPIIYLVIMAVGMIIVLIGILRLAAQGEVTNKKPQSEPELSDVFHYFLQEEEKKNNDMRKMLIKVQDTKESQQETQKIQSAMKPQKRVDQEKIEKIEINNDFENIIARYKKGETIDQIAKALEKGVGEVKLILSLYAAENQ